MKSRMKRMAASILALLILAAFTCAARVANANVSTGMKVVAPCEAGERWSFTNEVPAEQREEFRSFLGGTSSAPRSLSESVAFRRNTRVGTSRSFGDYWIARTLMKAGLSHAAFQGFSAILVRSREPDESLIVQRASLACVSRLVRENPNFTLPEGIARTIRELLSASGSPDEKRTLFETAMLLLKQQVERGRPTEEIQYTVSLLRGGGPFEAFSLGIMATLTRDDRGTAAEMERFLSLQSQLTRRERSLERHEDHARLVAARAYFAMKKYDEAGRHLKFVSRSSNDLPNALSELAWSALGSKNYGEAIGAAIGLQSGGLRRVFAPETPMVLAMAMNELCQYPEALRAVRQFRKDYEPSYRWLKGWDSDPKKNHDALNVAAVEFLRKRRSSVPERVASEWVRSPVFLSSQLELNAIEDEASVMRKISEAGAAEAKRMAKELRSISQALASRLRAEKRLAAGKKAISQELRSDLGKLLVISRHYQRLRAGGPVWRNLVESQQVAAQSSRKAALQRIASDLAARNARMLGMLEDVAENNRLIEVEIFDGASQDIIWQNAHPDYKTVVGRVNAEKNRVRADKVWNWGSAPIGSDAWTEVWEDEIGAFQSNLFNNCSNKERYLAIKKSMIPRERSS